MKHVLSIFMSCFSAISCFAQSYDKTANGVKTVVNSVNIVVEFYSPEVVRIVKFPLSEKFDTKSLSVIKKPDQTKFHVRQNGSDIDIASDKVMVTIHTNNGIITFKKTNGDVLLNEKGQTSFLPYNDARNKTYSVKQTFALDADEPIYGLGIMQRDKLSLRGLNVKMIQGNTSDFESFFQSVKGYGLFWDNYSPTRFTDDKEGTTFNSEVGDGIDYYFMYGKNVDGVIAQMRNLTGQVPMFPLWTYGYWQSKERYETQEEITGVVKKYRDLGVPLDGIIQDWQYWGNNYQWNAMEFLGAGYSNPKKMIKDIHDMHAKLAVSIWSSFGPMTKPYRNLDKKGMLFNFTTWPQSGRSEVWPPDLDYPSGVRVYDAYNPSARDVYWKYLNQGLFSLGVDAWWMDSSEPDHIDQKPEDFDTKTYLGTFRKVRNAFPLMTVGGVYDHQRHETSQKRVFILTRSAFAGQQRYGASVWSGDLSSSWASLKNQIPAGLNFTMTGNPNFNSDIGGFFAGSYNKKFHDGFGSKNPMFQELYVRWLEYATFTPMMRSHGTDIPREIYQFGKNGEPVYDAIEKFINMRYSLLPYTYSTSWNVTNKQASFMRALVMDFANDKKTWELNNEYLYGKSILVAPILDAQYTPEKIVVTNEMDGWNKDSTKNDPTIKADFTQTKSTKVYLPAGTSWFDYWTNEKLDGGQEVTRATTIDMIPLFVKAGSIIPIGPKVQYATEKKWGNLQIKVYPGADGNFVFYEDEFDNYNYEKGAYSEIPFTWNNGSKKLTIGDRKGTFDGMINQRTFTIVLLDGKQKVVSYAGKKISISF